MAAPAAPEPPAATPVLEETTILATGIYLGGRPSLVIGLPYGIGTRGDRVVVTGPLTSSPGLVVGEWSKETAEITVTGNQGLLTAGSRRHRNPEVGLIFGSLAVGRGVDLEARLRPAVSGAAESGGPPESGGPAASEGLEASAAPGDSR